MRNHQETLRLNTKGKRLLIYYEDDDYDGDDGDEGCNGYHNEDDEDGKDQHKDFPGPSSNIVGSSSKPE